MLRRAEGQRRCDHLPGGITQLEAQGPSRTCNQSKEGEAESQVGDTVFGHRVPDTVSQLRSWGAGGSHPPQQDEREGQEALLAPHAPNTGL